MFLLVTEPVINNSDFFLQYPLEASVTVPDMESIPILMSAILVHILPGLLIAIFQKLLNVLHGQVVLTGTAMLK